MTTHQWEWNGDAVIYPRATADHSEPLPVVVRARILVTGGRRYADRSMVFAVLDDVAREVGDVLIVHGGAPGADALACEWAKERGQATEFHPASWSSHGRAAGPIRNQAMVDRGAAWCVVFPGGRGTADCAARAKRAGIRIWLVR